MQTGRKQLDERIGRYRLIRLLGEGGMAQVYEGFDDQLQRRVAIKVSRPGTLCDRAWRARFQDEGRLANQIAHPAFVAVNELGELEDGRCFLVMEFLCGETLAQRLRQRPTRPVTLLEALRLVRQIAAAMAFSHERGIIHRDLKPENLFLVDDAEVTGGQRVKILDLGIAKIEAKLEGGCERRRGHDTLPGLGLGTPGYLAPEQILTASEVDSRADVYSLGVILFELLLGTRPYVRQQADQELRAQLTQVLPPISALAPALPARLQRLIERMLAREPAQRPTMLEVQSSMQGLCSGSTDIVLTPPRRPQRWRSLVAGALISFLPVAITTLRMGPTVWPHKMQSNESTGVGDETRIASALSSTLMSIPQTPLRDEKIVSPPPSTPSGKQLPAQKPPQPPTPPKQGASSSPIRRLLHGDIKRL
jgi:serine/threonine protein kinase